MSEPNDHRRYTFGALRLYAAVLRNNKDEFRAFLINKGYTESDLIKVKQAFESLKTKTPVDNKTIL